MVPAGSPIAEIAFSVVYTYLLWVFLEPRSLTLLSIALGLRGSYGTGPIAVR